MSEWISVKDRFPEISLDPEADYQKQKAHVIVATRGGYVKEMVYTWQRFAKTEKGRKPRWEETSGQLAWDNVTHWMPFPEHPNKQNGGA